MALKELALIFICALPGCAKTSLQSDETYRPPNGYVPDEATAIAIAVAVWTPIYGKEKILSEKPFVARLDGDVWSVHGTLREGWIGGTAEAEISKEDGRILSVMHGK
jgi:hypothetical protein